MKKITEDDYPLVLPDPAAILNLSLDGGFTRHFYLLGGKDTLDLERRVRQALKSIYSGYSIRNLNIERSMGGSQYASLVTSDHLRASKVHTPQHMARIIDENVVVWESGDIYFDITD